MSAVDLKDLHAKLLEEYTGLFCPSGTLPDISPLGTPLHVLDLSGPNLGSIDIEPWPDRERPPSQPFPSGFHLSWRPTVLARGCTLLSRTELSSKTATDSLLLGERAVRILAVVAGQCEVTEAMEPLSLDVGPVRTEHLDPLRRQISRSAA